MLKKINDKYMIDEYGAIFNTYTKKYIKQYDNGFGYKYVVLTLNGKYKQYKVHRLVAEAFIPNPKNKPFVNHLDCNRSNNYYKNLEWCTQQYNIQHAYNTGLKMGVSAEHKGIYNPNVKLNEQDVLNIINDKKIGISIKDSYSKYKNKITFKGFENVWFGYTWKNLVEKVGEDKDDLQK